MFARRLGLDELDAKVSGLDKAITNAEALAKEFAQVVNAKEPAHV